MRRHLSKFILVLLIGLLGATLYSASGTPSTLVVRTDANNYLLVTSVTQTNPVTQGVFSSRTLRTDSSGSLQVILTGTVTPTYPQSIPASTCAAPSLGESGAATTGIAFTATPSILNCISGIARTTLTASSYTLTVPILAADGTGAAPSYSFASDTDLGAYRSSDNVFSIAVLGSERHQFGASTYRMLHDSAAITMGSASDVSLSRGAANELWLAVNDLFRFQATALTTTSTDGLIGINTTAAVVGTQVQISPRVRLSGTGWDVDDAVSRTVSFFTETLPVAGNTVSGTWKLGFIDPVTSAITYPLTVDSAGAGNISIFGTSLLYFTGRGTLSFDANGLPQFKEAGSSFGIQLNTGTAEPTVTSCGTGTVTAGSRNTAGQITATGATSCTVTFGAPAWTNTPFCVATDGTGARALFITSPSTTAFTVSGLTAGDVFRYVCIGRI